MKKIVIDDAVPYAKEMFASLGEVVCLPGKDIDAQAVKYADALIIRSRTQINHELLSESQVQFIGSTVVGLDHIDFDYLANTEIKFYSAQGCNANSVAEYVINCLVALAEQQQFQLAEKSLAIIGVGQVGKRLQAKAAALGMSVLLNDPPRQEQEPENQSVFCSLETALEADIISLHTPLTTSGGHPTAKLLNTERLKGLRSDQILINAARGGIVDETAWSRTKLQAKLIDCWQNEPNIAADLYYAADLATPHIAGHSLDAKIAGSEMAYQALCQFWQQPTQNAWQAHLPERPKTIEIAPKNHINKIDTSEYNWQSQLNQVLQACYQPWQDDLAIRSTDIEQVQAQFEYYRRHYPIYREWHQQTVTSTQDQNLNKLLIKLGFNLV